MRPKFSVNDRKTDRAVSGVPNRALDALDGLSKLRPIEAK